MNRKKAVLTLLIVGACAFFYSLIFRAPQKKVPTETVRHIKEDYGPYFFSIPITKFTRANQPCLSIQMNGSEVLVMLDLGFRGEFGFSEDFLSSIPQKKYLRTEKMYGVRGNEYNEKLYEIPNIEVGPIHFSSPKLQEWAEKSRQDATLRKKDNDLSMAEPGKIGWELFGNTNLFLDIKNSKIAFCDSLETLKKQGYQTEAFVKTPLLLERGLVEIETRTSAGTLRCMLDTGATWNLLNTDLPEGISLDQAIQDPNHLTKYPLFRIGENDFGPIAFHCVPIQIPIRVEAILGMEFFQEHAVFLDFAENLAYIDQAAQ